MQIAGGGDVNGDGKLDFVTGRGYFDNGGDNDIGQVNIHNGANPTAASFSNGVAASDLFGSSVAMTDFNGDGYADVFAGAQTAGGLLGQVSYFSGNSGFGFSSAPFTGLDSGAGGDQLGLSMTSLSDYNNDGFGDLAVGGNGFVNIYLGGSTYNGVADFTIAAPIDTTTYDLPLFNLGDIDGDGRSDLMIGATGANGNAGSAYISLGGSGVVSFTIDPAAGEEIAGGGSAGDFNGDGYDDIFIATRNGNMVDGYVIYGGTSLSDITLDPSWMTNNPGAGFHMTLNLNGLLANPTTDHVGLMATSIGDQNGDGFEDLLLSSSEINNGAGGAYIVYGRADPYDLAAPDPEVHTDAGPNANAGFDMISSSNNDGLVGSAANNIMANLNGSNIHTGVSFQAGGGNDIIRLYGTGNGVARAIDGGAGRDELHLFTTGTIDLRNVSEMNSVEEIAFQGAATQNLTLGLNDIFSLMQSSSELIDADGAGALTPRYSLMITNDGTAGTKALTIDNPNGGATMATAGFTINGTYNDGSSTYDIYTFGGGYQLLIEQNISVTVN